jgi:pyroglutamyl-peptidase
VNDWILVTGFGPFPGVEVNPTQTLAERLSNTTFHDMPVVSRVLDVSYQRSAEQLFEHLGGAWPHCIVHFGVATGSDQVRIETQAVNRKAADIPDVDGEEFEQAVVHADHPLDAVLQTRLRADQIVASLNENGFPARTSDNAGRYVCNSLYFNSLAFLELSGVERPSVFVHMPPVGADPEPDSPEQTSWTDERLFEAAAHLVGWIAANT